MKHKHSSDRNFKVTIQAKHLPFSLSLLVLGLLVLQGLQKPHCCYRISLVESMAKSDHKLWLHS